MELQSFTKKIVIIGEMILLLFGFCACGPLRSDRYTNKKTQEVVNKLVEILETEDREALKALLTEDALNSSDIDKGIDYTFELFSGSVQTVKKISLNMSELLGDGKRFQMGQGNYRIFTEEEEYRLYFEYIFVDQLNSNNVEKIQKLKLSRQSDLKKDGDSYIPANGYTSLGIYNPEWDERDRPILQKEETSNVVFKLVDAIENEDRKQFVGLLTEEALATVDLDVGIDYTFDLFSGSRDILAENYIKIKNQKAQENTKTIAYASYNITADETEYNLYFEYILEDSLNTDNKKKIQKIKLVKIADIISAGSDYIPGETHSSIGIYNPEWDERDREPENSITE